jgi:hypothetical protein
VKVSPTTLTVRVSVAGCLAAWAFALWRPDVADIYTTVVHRDTTITVPRSREDAARDAVLESAPTLAKSGTRWPPPRSLGRRNSYAASCRGVLNALRQLWARRHHVRLPLHHRTRSQSLGAVPRKRSAAWPRSASRTSQPEPRRPHTVAGTRRNTGITADCTRRDQGMTISVQSRSI